MITFLSAGFTTPYNDVLNPFSLWVHFFPVFLLIMPFKVFEKWVGFQTVTIQMNATEQHLRLLCS